MVNKERDEELLLVSAKCQVFRTSLSEISSQGRITQGVIIWKPDAGDEVVSLACMTERDPVLSGPGSNGKSDGAVSSNGSSASSTGK